MKEYSGHMEEVRYPAESMIVSLILIYLSPFISLYLNYLAFGICVLRVIRYDESVFAVDYCVLSAVSYIFRSTGNVALLAWLIIVAEFWYLIKDGIWKNTSLVLLLLLLSYMLLRMQTSVNTFVLIFSEFLLMYVLFNSQKSEWIVPCIKGFCASILLASIYAYVFRYSSQLIALLGSEGSAYWGSSLTRFQGPFRDPNYYMSMVAVAIALIVMLFLSGHTSLPACLVSVACLVYFGAITYSKTFLIVLALAVVMFVIILFFQRRLDLFKLQWILRKLVLKNLILVILIQ